MLTLINQFFFFLLNGIGNPTPPNYREKEFRDYKSPRPIIKQEYMLIIPEISALTENTYSHFQSNRLNLGLAVPAAHSILPSIFAKTGAHAKLRRAGHLNFPFVYCCLHFKL